MRAGMHSKRENRRGTRLGLPCLFAAAAFFCLLYAMAEYDLTTGHRLPPHSSLRYDPFGTSGLRELFVRRGRETHMLQRPVPPEEAGATLVMLPPVGADYDEDFDSSRFTARRMRRLDEWIRNGNRLLLLARVPPKTLAALLPGLSFTAASGPELSLEKKQASGDYRGAFSEPATTVALTGRDAGSSLLMVRPGSIRVADDSEAEILAGDGGDAKVVVLSLGQGSVVVLANPTPALNQAVDQASNAAFLLELSVDGPVYFDEYSLGLGDGDSTMDWLKRYSLLPFLLQAGLALYLFARSGDRDIEQSVVREEKSASPAGDQIRMLVGLYEKSLSDGQLAEKRRRLSGRLKAREGGVARRL